MEKINKDLIATWLSQELGINKKEILQDNQLYSNGTLTSFTIVKLVRFIETKANRRIAKENLVMENFESLESILNCITK